MNSSFDKIINNIFLSIKRILILFVNLILIIKFTKTNTFSHINKNLYDYLISTTEF
jgi:hypothetical protein